MYRPGHDFGYWFTFALMLLLLLAGATTLFASGAVLPAALCVFAFVLWLKSERDGYRLIRESEREMDRVEQIWRDAGEEELADEIHAWRERL